MRLYQLLGRDGVAFDSATPGSLGGNRAGKLYGRLDCPSALAALKKNRGYAERRVFFADEETANTAGYRPCARCMPNEYAAWKATGRVR